MKWWCRCGNGNGVFEGAADGTGRWWGKEWDKQHVVDKDKKV